MCKRPVLCGLECRPAAAHHPPRWCLVPPQTGNARLRRDCEATRAVPARSPGRYRVCAATLSIIRWFAGGALIIWRRSSSPCIRRRPILSVRLAFSSEYERRACHFTLSASSSAASSNKFTAGGFGGTARTSRAAGIEGSGRSADQFLARSGTSPQNEALRVLLDQKGAVDPDDWQDEISSVLRRMSAGKRRPCGGAFRFKALSERSDWGQRNILHPAF